MLKYYNAMVVFEEIPDEITLAINITNCPCHCVGCHSKFLWEDVGTEHPLRRVQSIGKVIEVSAVTFPAYSATSIQARGLADALDNAKASLDNERAKLAKIEKQKQKIRILMEM